MAAARDARLVPSRPRLVRLVRELVEERLSDAPARAHLAGRRASPDEWAPGCCPGRG
jgi:hypothetical protein